MLVCVCSNYTSLVFPSYLQPAVCWSPSLPPFHSCKPKSCCCYSSTCRTITCSVQTPLMNPFASQHLIPPSSLAGWAGVGWAAWGHRQQVGGDLHTAAERLTSVTQSFASLLRNIPLQLSFNETSCQITIELCTLTSRALRLEGVSLWSLGITSWLAHSSFPPLPGLL